MDDDAVTAGAETVSCPADGALLVEDIDWDDVPAKRKTTNTTMIMTIMTRIVFTIFDIY